MSPCIPSILMVALHIPALPPPPPPVSEPPPSWVDPESPMLSDQRQLTFPDRFHKAGEAYFSPDQRRIIFQAIDAVSGDEDPGGFYAMYCADLMRNLDGRISGISGIRCLSPPGSANTCGWFHPTEEHVVYFASTLLPPEETESPGYNRGTGRYTWMFPPHMQIYSCDLDAPTGLITSLQHVVGDDRHYQAEGALNADGSYLVYCSHATGNGDLYAHEIRTGRDIPLVLEEGYDGGPFFSPGGERICYRSDRARNDLLQIIVADLDVDGHGRIRGITGEHAVTSNQHVNWGPYWHPGGAHLVYASSEMGHRNYELFLVGAPGAGGYGSKKCRLTHASGADILPVFSGDGKLMMWTSQRGTGGSSQLWLADFLLPVDLPRDDR